jgi:hypothetical protein
MAVASGTPTLGEVMLREGIVTQSQLRAALSQQKKTAHSLGRVLVDLGYISEDVRTSTLKKAFGLQTIDVKGVKVDQLLTVLIPPAFAHKHRILPIRQEDGGTLVVAMEDPSDLMVVDAMKNQVGMKIKPFIANSKDLVESIIQHYHGEKAPPRAAASSGASRKVLWMALKVFFSAMYFAPIVVGFLLLMFSQEVRDFVGGTTTFDLVLYAVLLSALWAIIIFEINGLLFGREGAEEGK